MYLIIAQCRYQQSYRLFVYQRAWKTAEKDRDVDCAGPGMEPSDYQSFRS